jgi:hypothetical protein
VVLASKAGAGSLRRGMVGQLLMSDMVFPFI